MPEEQAPHAASEPDVADTTAPTPPEGGEKTTFTKAEVEKLMADRLARETRQREKAIADGVQAQLARQITEMTTTLRSRLVHAEAEALALAAGVRAEDVGSVLKLADITGALLDDAGEPDRAALRASIDAVLTAHPFFRVGAPNGFGGEYVGGDNAAVSLDRQLTESLQRGDTLTYLALQNRKYQIGG